MSYILDALTKAAQQRDRQAPVVQRLLSPAPRSRSMWSPTPGRLLAALAVNAVLMAGVLVWWLSPAAVSAPPPEPIAAPAPVVAPALPAAESPRPLVKLEPLPRAATTVDKPTPTPTERAAETPEKPAPPPPSVAPAPRAPIPNSAPSALPRSGTPTIQLSPAPPATAARPALPQEAAGLKLEALIYADVPAERMVFINGRRYREGDSIDGRLRVEEIHEDGVELSDQGRRFSLRVSR